MNSLKGQFILDGGTLAGSPFHRTVVLICQHDATGAFGLVLNRPSPHKVGEALDELLPEPVKSLMVFVGGPVQPQALSYLIYDPSGTQSGEQIVLPGLRLTHTLDELETISPEAQLKFFAGYAGWSPGQLDNEMKLKAWLTHPASIGDVFCSKPTELWKTIIRTKGMEYRLLADAPDDISNN
jgi:putative transcriptional regulator